MKINPSTLQQWNHARRCLVYLPVLYIDGKLTTIDDSMVHTYVNEDDALKMAKRLAGHVSLRLNKGGKS